MRLFLILLVVPIIEIGLFIEVGGWIGTWPTIGIVVLTALAGSFLLRQQGLAALAEVQSQLATGEDPGALLAKGAMILFAGALLLTPGFFTDAVGFALLIPGVRSALWRWIAARVTVATAGGGKAGWQHQTSGATTVDGQYTEAETENRVLEPETLEHNQPLNRSQ